MYAAEFNLEFGKYFNNIPVLPFVMTSFYDSPRLIKTHKENRQLVWNSNKSLVKSKHYNITKETSNIYWWDKENLKPGNELTHEEVNQNFKKIINSEKTFKSDKNLLNFNYNTDITFF
jgi:hypothetical protein